MSCNDTHSKLTFEVYETSANGNKLTKISDFPKANAMVKITVDSTQTFQTITGFGGAFTESSAYLLNKMSSAQRDNILKAYFSEDGANYSLTRTHMNSCDFSLSNYSYAEIEGDTLLEHFSIKHDKTDLIPMIKSAQDISNEGFKIMASPWTAPPWMKDNKNWVGGKLLPEYYNTWALFFSKYIKAYQNEGIPIWGFTVENEPHGNGNNWESMIFSPKEMTDFVVNYLGPKLEADGFGDKIILGYDQNRAGLKEWVDEMYRDEKSRQYFDGVAVHWYESTFEVFPEALQYAKQKAPNKYLIQTEACIDAEVPKWQDDAWYWSKEATDWGWDWAPENEKYLHPKYVPVYRYASDIIGCLNNGVDGWVDWNMVLDKQGGPNWFKNWCVAPVLVDPDTDTVYYTPLYYVMAHFSKYLRPGSKVIKAVSSEEALQVTAVLNKDNSVSVVVFNPLEIPLNIQLTLNEKSIDFGISGKALQTIIIPKN